MQEGEKDEDDDMEEIEYDDEIEDEDDTKLSTDCIIAFVMQNTTNFPVTMTLIFPETMRQGCNFRVPVTEWSFEIKQRDKDIKVKLPKLDLMNDWGEALKDLRVLVDGVDMSNGQ